MVPGRGATQTSQLVALSGLIGEHVPRLPHVHVFSMQFRRGINSVRQPRGTQGDEPIHVRSCGRQRDCNGGGAVRVRDGVGGEHGSTAARTASASTDACPASNSMSAIAPCLPRAAPQRPYT